MIDIKSNQRSLIVGPTGSGKSVLAKYIVRDWGRRGGTLIAYDEKGDFDIPGAKIITGLKELNEVQAGRYVVRPPLEIVSNAKRKRKFLDAFFLMVLHGKNTLLVIDEVLAVVDGGANDPPDGLVGIITRGRGLNVGLIALTQRPARIPLYFKTEAEHVFTFWLQEPDDRARISKSLDFDALGEYEFYYMAQRSREAAKYKLEGEKRLKCLD